MASYAVKPSEMLLCSSVCRQAGVSRLGGMGGLINNLKLEPF